jgi:hypothetical protein
MAFREPRQPIRKKPRRQAKRRARLLKLPAVRRWSATGVDKRIDVLSVATQAPIAVFDLEEMELAYAPQFGLAKDPVNMVGFVASGMLRGEHPQMDVESLPARGSFILDVRTPTEFRPEGSLARRTSR